ncbi:MAG: M20/M25/M40 family metallo-hydrolase [Verrucomicrobia bacterium]|nr:M20/M25/M40 family metallo-hydrolase [Verrucomicrobiota bacterium]
MKPPRRPSSWALAVALGAALQLHAQTPTPPAASAATTDDPIARIREEGLNRSKVMETLSYLTDVIGPRVTGSTQMRRANEWTRDQFTAWGLANARLESWGPFGRGWELKRFSAQIVAPQSIPLIAFPKAWSPGLGDRPLEAEVVHVDIKKAEDFGKYRGQLRGKIVLDGGLQELKMSFDPLANRRSEANLLGLANAEPGTSGVTRARTPNPLTTPEGRATAALQPRRYQFFADEGVAVLLQASRLGEAGNLFTQGATVYPARAANAEPPPPDTAAKKGPGGRGGPRTASPWTTDCPPIIPQITVSAEHYNRLVRLTQQGEKLRAAIELQAGYLTADLMAANTLADLPGSDLANEIVMIGAHLDSWQSGTGATDNAAGSAVAMEAMRILQALDLKPRRTIRVGLWSGEEQGLLGSKAYVAAHFGAVKSATPAAAAERNESDPFAVGPRPTGPIEKKPAHDHLSAYFNLDNGGGKIRGVYLQGNEAARPIFRAWLKPFRDLGAETLSIANTGGTDHLSFDNVGLPGFQFIQDELEYWTRTHHGNMDVYDRVVADDLKQASVIMAAFAYQAAMRDEKIPRKPVPSPAATATANAADAAKRTPAGSQQ